MSLQLVLDPSAPPATLLTGVQGNTSNPAIDLTVTPALRRCSGARLGISFTMHFKGGFCLQTRTFSNLFNTVTFGDA